MATRQDLPAPFLIDQGICETHSEYPVRPDGCIASVAVHYVVQQFLFRGSRESDKVNADVLRHFSQKQFGAAVASSSRKFFQDSQRVLPKGFDFDGLAGSRRHDPVADLPA
jgi:hypothetical protein